MEEFNAERLTPVIYVDIDDTLVRSFGSKRMPMSHMVALVRATALMRFCPSHTCCWMTCR